MLCFLPTNRNCETVGVTTIDYARFLSLGRWAYFLEEKMKESKLETPLKCKFLQSDHIRLRSIYCTLKQGPHSAVNIQPKRMMDIGEEKTVLKVHFSFYGQATVPKRPCFFSNSSQIAYSQRIHEWWRSWWISLLWVQQQLLEDFNNHCVWTEKMVKKCARKNVRLVTCADTF